MKSSIFAVTVVVQSVLAFGDSQVVNGIEWRYLSDDGGVVLCSGERDEWDDYRGGTTIDVATCGDVVVPNELGGLPVTMIGNGAFKGCKRITSVVLPDTVEAIDSMSFAGCVALTNLVIKEGATAVSMNAFSGCLRLTQVILPNSVRELCGRDFPNNVEIALKDDHPKYKIVNGGLYDRKMTTLFGCCSTGKRFVVPEGVKRISGSAFAYSDYEEVILPESLEEIGAEAFESCHELISIDIPKGVKRIAEDAFARCELLSVVYYHGRRCQIADNAFTGCGSILSLVPEKMGWENEAGVLAGKRRRKGDHYANAYWSPCSDRIAKGNLVEAELLKRDDRSSCKALVKYYERNRIRNEHIKSAVERGINRAKAVSWRDEKCLGWFKNRLGECYRDGEGCAVDLVKAKQKFLEAIQDGSSEACFNYARLFHDEKPDDFMTAKVLLSGCAVRERERAKGFCLLGDWCRERGAMREALNYYEKALEMRHVKYEDVIHMRAALTDLKDK